MPSNQFILCHLLLPLPSVFPSIGVFSNELALSIRQPKFQSFSFTISPFNDYSGLISFKTDLLDLIAVQGTLKSLLQHHSGKASILWCLAFFMVQFSHLYMTTGKTIALTTGTFVGKQCLCFLILWDHLKPSSGLEIPLCCCRILIFVSISLVRFSSVQSPSRV